MVESAIYETSGTTSFGYEYITNTNDMGELTRKSISIKSKSIGKFNLPYEVYIIYGNEEDSVCVSCEEFSIVSCADTVMEAKNRLERELEDAILLYVHVLKEDELDSKAMRYRSKLSEIEGLNTV
jgi:predicted RNase H-like HicB family nuclease